MELNIFKNKLTDDLRAIADSEFSSEREEFVNYVSDILLEAEEIEDPIEFLPFEGVSSGKGRKKIQIDGYTYNELDEYLSLYIVADMTYGENIETLTNTEAVKYFKRAVAFIEEAPKIIKNAEESAPAYGLAIDIANKYKSVRKYCIYLLTDMNMSKNIKVIEGESIGKIPVEYHIWDINRIHQITESKRGKEDIVIDFTKYDDKGIQCIPASETEDYTAYLCNIPGIVLAELYNNYGGRLLEGNVRSFLQTRGKVNKGIRNTILNSPEMFFAYNNGIAATAYNVKTEIKDSALYITEITSLQIVNGGQTTVSLATALLKDKKDDSEEKIKRIFVPMKLSIVSPEKAEELIPNISRYANSQNKVSESDLWSNHPFHVRMESISRRVLAPAVNGQQYGTYWYYERAKGQYKQETYKVSESVKKRFEMQNPKSQMFTKTDLAKYINIRRMLPHIASKGGQKSFADFAEWASGIWEKNEAKFNENFFKQAVSIAIIFKKADKIVKSQPWYNSYKANIVIYTISKIIYTVKNDYRDKEIDYKSIWIRQSLSEAWINQITILSEKIYKFLIDDERPVENVTEWAKKEQCWKNAKKIKINLEQNFINELVDKLEFKEMENEAKKIQKLDNELGDLIKITNFGIDNWKALITWDSSHKILNAKDRCMIGIAINIVSGKTPTKRQCSAILKTLEKAKEWGFSV